MSPFTLVPAPNPRPFVPSPALLESASQRPPLTRAHTTPAPTLEPPPSLGAHPQSFILQLSPEQRALIEPLASLASQHHLSEYSKVKFGPRGCPTLYFPLSITAPAHVEDLRKRQELNVARPCFFIAQPDTRPHPASQHPPVSSSPTKRSMEVDEEHERRSVDMDGERSIRGVRTSLASEPMRIRLLQRRPVPVIHPPSSPQLEEALTLAIASPLLLPSPVQTIVLEQAPQQSSAKPKTSESHPINISYLLPPESVPVISAHLASSYPHLLSHQLHPAHGNPACPPIDPFLQLALPSSIWEMAFVPAFATPQPTVISPRSPLPSFTAQLIAPLYPHHPSRPTMDRSYTAPPLQTLPIHFSIPTPLPIPSTPQIGNLLLSSCPGKKVRLTGPVKGRGAICRSLPSDLSRIRSLGVKLIINCLDDTELQFLGSPWHEYAATAGTLGIDVLRIPTPEGFSPLDPERLDGLLEWVIRGYTMKGLNVLVHCRGGVGRAGLVAASWAIKMGLCGPIPDVDDGNTWEDLVVQGRIRRDSLAVVQRVVGVVRRRRSVKAIETYEQARFLLDFVEFLRERKVRRGRDGCSPSPCRNSPCLTGSESGSEDTLVDLEISLPEGVEVKAPGEDDITPRAGKDLESPLLMDAYSQMTF